MLCIDGRHGVWEPRTRGCTSACSCRPTAARHLLAESHGRWLPRPGAQTAPHSPTPRSADRPHAPGAPWAHSPCSRDAAACMHTVLTVAYPAPQSRRPAHPRAHRRQKVPACGHAPLSGRCCSHLPPNHRGRTPQSQVQSHRVTTRRRAATGSPAAQAGRRERARPPSAGCATQPCCTRAKVMAARRRSSTVVGRMSGRRKRGGILGRTR